MISESEFFNFFNSKAYDVISNGNFRKHLMICRDRGDLWATSMSSDQTKVYQECKNVFHLLSFSTTSNEFWISVCKDVMSSAQPPTKVIMGHSVCAFSKENLDCFLDLTKNNKKEKIIHVHLRFYHFFLFLWFVAKLEYITRACTKHWLESSCNKFHQNEKNYTYLCELFSDEKKDFTAALYRAFTKALNYVVKTIELYNEEFQVVPVLKENKPKH